MLGLEVQQWGSGWTWSPRRGLRNEAPCRWGGPLPTGCFLLPQSAAATLATQLGRALGFLCKAQAAAPCTVHGPALR